MDDRFMHDLKQEPDPGFARALREKLRAQETPRAEWGWRLAPALATAAAVCVAVALFTLPSVRVSAQALLDLFRVRKFAAVEFDESRLERLRTLQKDDAMLIFDRTEKVVDPGPPRPYPTLEAAGAATGLSLRRPTYLPAGLMADSVFVEGAGEARLAVSESRLRTLLDQLDLRDVQVPSGLDGRWLEVRKPPVVIQKFTSGGSEVGFVQGTSPEVSVPSGIDVERLAEVGLRVLGLDAGEARRIARATDWRSTLLVPVPIDAATFRQVTVHGQPGLLITRTRARSNLGQPRVGTMVMWTEGDRVYGLMSTLGPPDVMQMAESVQ